MDIFEVNTNLSCERIEKKIDSQDFCKLPLLLWAMLDNLVGKGFNPKPRRTIFHEPTSILFNNFLKGSCLEIPKYFFLI